MTINIVIIKTLRVNYSQYGDGIAWFQTCYEMERYLKDEPKMQQQLKKLPSDIETTWLKMEVELDDFSERHLDALSTSSASSAFSWDSGTLSCAVLVKQVRLTLSSTHTNSC